MSVPMKVTRLAENTYAIDLASRGIGTSDMRVTASLNRDGTVTYSSDKLIMAPAWKAYGYADLFKQAGLPPLTEGTFESGYTFTSDSNFSRSMQIEQFEKVADIVEPNKNPPSTTSTIAPAANQSGTPTVSGAPSTAPAGSTGANISPTSATPATVADNPKQGALPAPKTPNASETVTTYAGETGRPVIRIGEGDSAHDEVYVGGTPYAERIGSSNPSDNYVPKPIFDGLNQFAGSSDFNDFEFTPKNGGSPIKMSDALKSPDKYGLSPHMEDGKFVFKYNSTSGGHESNPHSEHNYGNAADVSAFIGRTSFYESVMTPADSDRFRKVAQDYMTKTTGYEYNFLPEARVGNSSKHEPTAGGHATHIEVKQTHPKGTNGKFLSPQQIQDIRRQMAKEGFSDSISSVDGKGGRDYRQYTVSATGGDNISGATAGTGSVIGGKLITNSKGQLEILGAAVKPFNTSSIIDLKNMPASDKSIKDLSKEYADEGGILEKFKNEKMKKNSYSGNPGSYGLERKIDMPAHIQIRPDVDYKKSGDTMYEKYQSANIQYIDCFILRSVRSRKEEKSHIFSSLGDEVIAFFFGKTPMVYSFGGTVLDAKNQRWMDDFNFYYDKYLRGSAATRNKTRIYVVFEDQLVEGYLLNLSMDKVSEMDIVSNITFDFLVTNSMVIGGYKDPVERKNISSVDTATKRSNVTSGLPESSAYKQALNNKLLGDIMGNQSQMRMPWGMLGVPPEAMKGLNLSKIVSDTKDSALSKLDAAKNASGPRATTSSSAVVDAELKGNINGKASIGNVLVDDLMTPTRTPVSTPKPSYGPMNATATLAKDPTVENRAMEIAKMGDSEAAQTLGIKSPDMLANDARVGLQAIQNVPPSTPLPYNKALDNYNAAQTNAVQIKSQTSDPMLISMAEKAANDAYAQLIAAKNASDAANANRLQPGVSVPTVAGAATKEQIKKQKNKG